MPHELESVPLESICFSLLIFFLVLFHLHLVKINGSFVRSLALSPHPILLLEFLFIANAMMIMMTIMKMVFALIMIWMRGKVCDMVTKYRMDKKAFCSFFQQHFLNHL